MQKIEYVKAIQRNPKESEVRTMEKFTKITTGFVTQSYEKNTDGKFVCTEQEFIAGDEVDYEDVDGDSIDSPEYEYQPFNMAMISSIQVIDQLRDVLTSIDVGGEQSRQFAEEIDMLKKVLKVLGCSVDQPKTVATQLFRSTTVGSM